jgi:hypothetical protein
MTTNKTHYRKAFDSPYLSSADIVEPTTLTVAYVRLEPDQTKKTKDLFNTAHFVEKELRPGEKLKPMILNATNSKTMKALTGSAFIDDWNDVRVMVYVDPSVRFGKESVEGLRISTKPCSMPVDVEALLAKVHGAVTADGLQDIWKSAGKALQEVGDRNGYAKVKAAVLAKLESIKNNTQVQQGASA